ncbi:MAG: DUF167 domain-containing protein [Chloroflexota bacterium]|nr:DUF167 domain-containing protein [Chloroflexota bacterium]
MSRTRLYLLVSPGAKQTQVTQGKDGALRVRVAAPATEGKANHELAAFLARRLDVTRSHVLLIQGMGSRHKVVEIEGMSRVEAVARLLS